MNHANKRGQWSRKATQKPDGLLNAEATALDSKIHYACAPFDRAERQANDIWGIDRLPELVGPVMAGKYGHCVGKLNEAIQAKDTLAVEQWAGVCIRGLAAMDKQARADNHTPAGDLFWEVKVPTPQGQPPRYVGIIKHPSDLAPAKAARPDLTFYNRHELGLAMEQWLTTPLVQVTKEKFPHATITRIKPRTPVDYRNGGDPIPEL